MRKPVFHALLMIITSATVAASAATVASAQVTATRTMPLECPAGASVEIGLDLEVDEGRAPNTVIVVETLPAGWTLESATPPQNTFDPVTRQVGWMFFGSDVNDAAMDVTYSAAPPAGATGIQAFSGEIQFNDEEGNPREFPVDGELACEVPEVFNTAIIKIPHASVNPGAAFALPVEVRGVENLGAASCEASFDTAFLTEPSCTPNPNGSFDQAQCNVIGEEALLLFNAVSFAGRTGNPVMSRLAFRAGGAPGMTVLSPQCKTFADVDGIDIPFEEQDGEIIIADPPSLLGDVNCDGVVDANDVRLMLRLDVRLTNPSGACPPPQDAAFVPACDVNRNEACNIIDALFTAQCLVRLRPCP